MLHTAHSMPCYTGIGLRHAHAEAVLERAPRLAFLEVHPENYLGGGKPRKQLMKLRQHYPISFHSVGLSLGSHQQPNVAYLHELKALVDEFEPFLFSDHAAWSRSGNAHMNDLLPLPYTEETLDTICRNIDIAQGILKRRLLIENPSTYVMFADAEMGETTFLNRIVGRTGCGLLLDINNIYVQSHNHGFDPMTYIYAIEEDAVEQFHLSGHSERKFEEGTLLIDTHDTPVADEVWNLFEHAVQRFGARSTLMEWDAQLPALDTLLAEARKADTIIGKHTRAALNVAA